MFAIRPTTLARRDEFEGLLNKTRVSGLPGAADFCINTGSALGKRRCDGGIPGVVRLLRKAQAPPPRAMQRTA